MRRTNTFLILSQLVPMEPELEYLSIRRINKFIQYLLLDWKKTMLFYWPTHFQNYYTNLKMMN